MKTTSEILSEAADLVETGWLRDKYHNEELTEFSAAGATIEADPEKCGLLADDYIAALVDGSGHINNTTVVDVWNDDPERTQAEVVDIMRIAASIAAGDEDCAS